MRKEDAIQYSPLVWAYMGDAVYEAFVREYVINQPLGAMTTFEYIWVVGMVSLGWLPTAIFELQSSVKVFRFPYATPIIAAVVTVFFIFCLRIILKKHR